MMSLKSIIITKLCVFRSCYTESIGVEDDQYPPNIAVLVNGHDCPVQVTHDNLHINDEHKQRVRLCLFVCLFVSNLRHNTMVMHKGPIWD